MSAATIRLAQVVLVLGATSIASGCGRQSPQEREQAAAWTLDRAAKDAHFAGSESPLTPDQRVAFRGLRYFPPSPRWVVTAELDRAARPDTVYFPTSKGGFDAYLRAGTLHFALAGRRQTLSLYRSPEDGHWFLPFTDATSGRSTYGAGRYLDPEVLEGQPVTLDFNRAYNPYCAYNADWSCPLAPPENRLPMGIEAGEKIFADGH
jgi:uncharacterized protein (DUF1684 family)